MTYTEDDLRIRMRQAYDMPYGSAQIALVEQVIQHADAGRFIDLSFAARMLATTAYVYGGEPAKSFLTFSWCLAEYDREPGRRSTQDDYTLLWHFKYMVNALARFPDIPLERTYAVLDDMERRYRAGGHSLHAVCHHRHLVAMHLGDADAADDWYGRWCAAPRDELSDCIGCDPTSKAFYLASRGRDEEAVALAEPVLCGQFTCHEQPQGILTALLLPYLRTGRLDQAVDAHRRAYRRLRSKLADLGSIADHVEFCALTGNDLRGLEIVQRHLEWLDRAPSPHAAMEFASAAALVLRRLDAAGHGDLTARRPAYGDRPAGDVEVAALGEDLAAYAIGIADSFDARNGTGHQSARVACRLAAAPLIEHLPLSATTRRRAAVLSAGVPDDAAAAETVADGATAVETTAVETTAAGTMAAGTTVVEPDASDESGGFELAIPDGATATELLDLAERFTRADRLGEARAVWRAFDERYGAQEVSILDTARRSDGLGQDLAESRDAAAAEAAWRRAMELYQQAGDEVRAEVARGRLGLLCCLTGRPGEGLEMVRHSAAYLLKHASAERCAGAESRVGTALLAIGRTEEALAALDRAAAHAAEADDAYQMADVGLRRAHCLSMMERPKEQREAAEQARERYRELGGDGYAAACLLYGDSFRDPTDATVALEAFEEAVRAAELGWGCWGTGGQGAAGPRPVGASASRVAVDARLARARVLCVLGRSAEAVDDFVEAVALYAEQDVAEGAAFTRFELAGAYRQASRLVEAAEAAEEAISALMALDAQETADRCRYLLVSIYRDLGEDEAALALLDELAANLDGFDNLASRARMYEEAGEIHYRADRDEVAAERFSAAATAFAQVGAALDELRARRRAALALHWAGAQDAALAALTEIDALVERLPAEIATQPAATWEKAMARYDATKILIGAERLDQALPYIRPAPAALRSIEAFGEALLAELLLGELLLRMDRPGEAEPVLRGVLAGLPQDSEPVPQAVWLLTEALTMLGRDEEASRLRTEYGLYPD
jgi:tetratricopeptide (TPR) repeat protein